MGVMRKGTNSGCSKLRSRSEKKKKLTRGNSKNKKRAADATYKTYRRGWKGDGIPVGAK